VFSKGGNFTFSFDSLDSAGAFVKGTVVSVDAGQGFATLPSAGLGGVTHGEITMKGKIESL
jgi:hypothetical protein